MGQDLYLVYIEYGGDMECHDFLYIRHKLCYGNSKEEVLREYQKFFKEDISDGTWFGRKIKMIKVPQEAEGCWTDLEIINVPKETDKLEIINKIKRKEKLTSKDLNSNYNYEYNGLENFRK